MSSIALDAQSLALNISTNDLAKSIKFYTDGLGFEIVHKHEENGTLMYVMLKAGNALMGLGQDDFAKGRDRKKGVGQRVWITTTQDIAALAERAKKGGITLDNGPAPLPWGPIAFAVTDPDGIMLTVSSPSEN